jgi:hypothetical protein
VSHSAIYDRSAERMVVFGGGASAGHYLNDTWALSMRGAPTWAQPTFAGTPPAARLGHSTTYDPVQNRMIVFGGYGVEYFNDVRSLRWPTVVGVDDRVARARVGGLRPPAPNPSDGRTTFSFSIAEAGRVQLGVYDVGGRLVRMLVDGQRGSGTETVLWSGTDESGARVPAGLYFVRLAGPRMHETRGIIMLR